MGKTFPGIVFIFDWIVMVLSDNQNTHKVSDVRNTIPFDYTLGLIALSVEKVHIWLSPDHSLLSFD